LQALSFRFSDGYHVSVIEFLEFFNSSIESRQARSVLIALKCGLSDIELTQCSEKSLVDEAIEKLHNLFSSVEKFLEKELFANNIIGVTETRRPMIDRESFEVCNVLK